ncbi:MAG: hypothetical protein QXL96_08820 [Ignisphaera sp.]
MFFSYRKSPLGTVVREHMASIVGVYSDRLKAEEDLENLRIRVSADLKIIDVWEIDNWEKIMRLDPDFLDVVKSCNGRYVLVAFWGSLEP